MHRAALLLCLAALAAILSGCIAPPPRDPWFAADRFISPADTVELAKLYCECVPYRCRRTPLDELDSQLIAAVRDGRGVSLADVERFASWAAECQTSLFQGVPLPDAGAKLRAFKLTVRPVN